tara:strand:+ start:490 stop:813 length:324 start_codon:yes stop_codon:yes gene_type:complete
MQKIGFRLQLKMATLDEYVARHSSVWPEMLEALSATGWTNYSLFLDRTDGTLFGYVETSSFQAAKEGMSRLEINTRWQAEMSHYFESLEGRNPDEGFTELEQVFFLA